MAILGLAIKSFRNRKFTTGLTVLSIALSVMLLLGIEKIRAGRKKPGLAAQHLTSIRAAAAICGASVDGDMLETFGGLLAFVTAKREEG